MLDKEILACPINIPAISNHQFPTEDQLRRIIGTLLSPQNLALQLIAEGLDAWGGSYKYLQMRTI